MNHNSRSHLPPHSVQTAPAPPLTLNLGSEDVIYYVFTSGFTLRTCSRWGEKAAASRRSYCTEYLESFPPTVAFFSVDIAIFGLTIHYNSPHTPATALARLNQTDRVWCRFWSKAPVTLIYKWAKGASCPCQGEVHNEGHIRVPCVQDSMSDIDHFPKNGNCGRKAAIAVPSITYWVALQHHCQVRLPVSSKDA